MSLEDEIQKLVAGYAGAAKKATQMEICALCEDALEIAGIKIESTCEYCGMQLLTGNRIIRVHFDPPLFFDLSEIHTPELCKSIRDGAPTVSEPFQNRVGDIITW